MSLNLQGKTATVFGATGFVGRYVVARLAAAGVTIRAVTRNPQSAYFLRTQGSVGQIVPVACAYRSAEDIDALVAGSDFVVNCLGILNETRRARFDKIHVTLPEWMARACVRHNVTRFVHISSLAAGTAKSRYATTKLAGEQAVFANCPNAVILRPGIIFGPEDEFFNMFASMARCAPVLPLIGGGKNKFQPVYVGDVADAAIAALSLAAVGEHNPCGRIYELGGPEILTFRDIYQRMFSYTHARRALMSLPWGLSKAIAALPLVPLTADQVVSLQSDNVVKTGFPTLAELGIRPTALDAVLPTYLDKYRAGGRFAAKKRA